MVDHYKVQQESLEAYHVASMHVHASRERDVLVALVLARRQARPQRRHRDARRRGRGVHAERPVPRRRRPPGRQPHDDRPRQGALPEPRDLQGHPRRAARARSSTARSSSARTRRRPTRSRPTARCCCPTTRTINTKPQLEIFADDVKCTHGAAIGQLDDDAIFYLRARGPDLLRGARHADPRLRRRHPRPREDRAAAAGARGRALRAAGEGSRGGRRGMTPASPHGRAGVRSLRRRSAVRRGLPDPAAAGRTASRSSTSTTRPRRRSRRPCSTRSTRYYTDDNANVHRGVHPLSERATRGVRGRARARCSAFLNAAEHARDRLHPRHHRGHQPRGAQLRPRRTSARATRSLISAMEHHSNIVPWQMLCEQTGRAAARRADRRPRRAAPRRVRARCSAPRTKLVAVAHVSNALGTINPVARDHRAWRTARRAGAGRRRAGGAAPAGRRAGARLRLLRVLRPQAVRPDRHRRALRQGGAARRDAAVPGRRRHDPLGHLREDDLQRAAVQVRGRHAEHRRRHRARRGASTTSTAIGLDAIAAHEQRAARRTRPTRCSAIAGRAADRHGAREGRRPVVRAGGRPPARHRHDPRPARASPSAPAITARSR